MDFRISRMVALVALLLTVGNTAYGDIISVAGPNSSRGVAPSIIAPPVSVFNSIIFNDAQQGFNERQNVLLQNDLAVDGGTIPAGTLVNSHMILFNIKDDENNTGDVRHLDVVWTFSGRILGVMSDNFGSLESASTSFLGAPGTNYPTAGFINRGMEPLLSPDSYLISGDELSVDMFVVQPGDWIRVITAVPEAGTLTLLAFGLTGLIASRGRRRPVA